MIVDFDVQRHASLSVSLDKLNESWRYENLIEFKESSNSWVRVCESQQGEVIGFYLANNIADQATLLFVWVEEASRRSGHGLSLLNDLLSISRAKGCSELQLEVRQSNASAIALYQRMDFTEVGRRKHYYPPRDNAGVGQNQREDALLYSLFF